MSHCLTVSLFAFVVSLLLSLDSGPFRLILTFVRNDEEQLQAELDWACRRPTARWSEDAPCKVSAANAFENALTEGEFGFLLGYQEKVPGGIYSLNQSPFVMCVGTNQPVQVSAP